MPEATHMCPADHEHGATSKCYLRHACRCAHCRAGQAGRARQRRREQAYGTYTRQMVDAAPARAHLAYLRANGMGITYIGAAAGIPSVTLSGIVWGRHDRSGALTPAKRIRKTTETAILAVQPTLDQLADHAIIDGRGTRRRIQALCRCGWSLQAIARHAGVAEYRFQRLVRAEHVIASTARFVAKTYEQLWDVPPPQATPAQRAMATRARAHAKKNRWVGPLAWDDIDTDARPLTAKRSSETDDVAIELALDGRPVRLTPAERRICVRRLHERQYSDGLIADTIRCDEKTVGRIRDELGLPAWAKDDLVERSAA